MFEGNTQNPKIMRSLSSEWSRTGNTVIKFYPCSSRKEVKLLNQDRSIYAFYFAERETYKRFLNALDACHYSLKSMGLCAIKHPICALEFVLRRIPFISSIFDEACIIKRKTERAIKKYKVDVVVAGSNPFFLPMGLARAKGECKRIWYQMDPHSTNGMMDATKVNREKAKERLVYERMDRIFVQPNSYRNIIDSLDRETASKVFSTKFPLVNPGILITPDITYFQKDTINCVYAGALMLPIRRPEYMFKMFSLFKNKSIRLYIWSGNLSESTEAEMRAMMPSNVSYCGSLSQSEMQSVLAGADFLVSLGNTVTNQLPSKLLDYISLKKPIINIYKSDDCPTKQILSEYPLSISINEKENEADAALRVEQFIQNTLGQQADSEIIERNYHEYLPNIVAEYILNT